ncbi:MAG: VOC family protein [Pseudomonadales bacterium]|nr:VOC family protein [Pseudomonadales bacterium]
MKINYVTIGTNDRKAAELFYDQLLSDSPFEKIYSEDRMTMWVNDGFMFALAEPFDGNEATVGNGSMFGIQVPGDAEVNRLYDLALSLGATDEGEPRIRSEHQSAYVRDLDGNKLCFYA